MLAASTVAASSIRAWPVSRSTAPWMARRCRPLACSTATWVSFAPQQPTGRTAWMGCAASPNSTASPSAKWFSRSSYASMNAACRAGSSLRDAAQGKRCSMPRRCSNAIRPDRPWQAMPNSASIQAPAWRVVRGSVPAIQAASLACCSSSRRQALPSSPKLARPSMPSSSKRRCQVRMVSSSTNSTRAIALQLMPSSSSASAFARRARRWAAEPSRANSIRSRRDAWSRTPERIISLVGSYSRRFARGDGRVFRESRHRKAH